MKLSAGMLLFRQKGRFKHKGIVNENGLIVHNTPERGEHQSTLSEFADGQSVFVEKIYQFNQFMRDKISQILSSPKPYCQYSNNCEDTAGKIIGIPGSPTRDLIYLGLFVGFVILAAPHLAKM